jgi:3-deoxy-7-phosphoheptulonate synthase
MPNYDAESVASAAQDLKSANLPPRLMVDVSHANSQKQYERQIPVAKNVAAQIADGSQYIMGLMIESHLKAGRQDVVANQPLTYGQSITDACINWEDSAALLHELAEAVQQRRKRTAS